MALLLALFNPVALFPACRANVTDCAGWLGLATFALSAWSLALTNQLALELCVVACLFSPIARSALSAEKIVRWSLLGALFLLAQSVRGMILLPETAQRQWLECGKWLLLFGFPVIGWWLNADPRRIDRVLCLALFGFLAGMLRHADWRNVARFHTGWQTGFQMDAATSGLISATAILGLLIFFPRILGRPQSGSHIRLKLFAWLAGLYLATYILVASQSRITWLGAAIVLPAVLGYRYVRSRRSVKPPARFMPALALLVLAMLGGGIMLNADTFLRRTGQDIGVVTAIVQDKTSNLPESSFSYRYHVQKFGLEKWLEKPLLGWGTGSPRVLIESSGRVELYNRPFGRWMRQMHNAYLEILVRFGVLGAGLFVIGIWHLVRSLAAARRRGKMPEDYWLFLAGAFALTGLWGFTNTFLWDAMRAYWLLLAGLGYTFVIHPQGAAPTEAAEPVASPS